MTEEPRTRADEMNERWRTLPVYLVRLAGFSFDRLDGLRCSRAASAARALEAAAAARRAAGHAFDEALARERFSEYPAFDDAAVRKAFTRNYKQARDFAKQLPAAPAPDEALREIVRVVPALGALTTELVDRHRAWCDAQRAFDAAFADEFEQTRGALRRLFQDPRLCEAVFLQSLDAFEAVQQMVAAAGPRNTRMRQRERLAAMYAQRFCAKNDTNAFCGPIGIGDAASEATRDGARPIAAVIDIAVEDARRRTYFSHWAAQRLLAEAVRRADDASLITLRLHPTARFDGGAVSWCVMEHDATMTFRRRYARSELPAGALPLVQALTTPRTLAELVALGGQLELGADETQSFLEQLIESGLVLRGPVLPPGLFYPLRAAAAEIERWPMSETRAWALGEIEAAEQLIAAFAQAPLRERIAIHRKLAARFEEATGSPASRGEGRHYADRSVLQEDCYVEVHSD
ncbi:MAG TPA: lantibiotic dehydratase, partial [Kofleriaceae bacterium]|nr:lantibiotic dehydratase [Kofleriaceae bacterium]